MRPFSKNYKGITLKDFIKSCFDSGANYETPIIVEQCDIKELDVFFIEDAKTFMIDPKLTWDKNSSSMTLKTFCDECSKLGVGLDDKISILDCNIEKFRYSKDKDFEGIFID